MRAWLGMVAAASAVLASVPPARAALAYGSNVVVNGMAGAGAGGYADTLSFAAVNTAPLAVPEPATLALVGAGLIGLGALRKRYRRWP